MKYEVDQVLPIPTLSGENICLRPCRHDDLEAIKAYRQDPENCRFIRPPESDQRIKEIVNHQSSHWQLSVGYWNVLMICQADKVAGHVAFRIENWENWRGELGYRLNQKFSGQGLCTAAVRIVVNYLFSEFNLHKLIACCDPRNVASYRVMEKLGMKREGHFTQHFLNDGEWTDQYQYGLLHSEWESKNRL
ncbi:GNAT family N-acetyltransferase [Aliikangiella coralliicola]|uniref:GNAT family N-acetyltransferase n=1 Tax=Aliikangiella coralliicola TaxID=2592383 RepID=A0A545UJH4_9GAMM|nr:GNAT family protein [Aliikangiella coralliicola]TQV89610.1 GNAT family N-acetyltransferase [Aliikangiella coralliicola]